MAISPRLAAELNKRPTFVDAFTRMTLHMQIRPCPNHAKHTPTEAKTCEDHRTFTSGTICGAVDILQASGVTLSDMTIPLLLAGCQATLGVKPIPGVHLAPAEFKWMLEELAANLELIEKCLQENPVPAPTSAPPAQ